MRASSALPFLALLAVACSDESLVRAVRAAEVGVVSQPNIVGRDGGPGAVLWGRSIWTFGDTVSATADTEGQTWHHNSFAELASFDAVRGDATLSTPADASGAPRYLVPPTRDEAAFNAAHRGDPCAETPCGARFAAWPGQPVWDAKRSRALVPYGLIYGEPGEFNFHGRGHSFAIWSAFEDDPQRPVLNAAAEHPTLLFGRDEPAFGKPWVEGGDLFAFACDDGWGKGCRLGRVVLESVLVRSAWRFWAGDGWSARVEDAATLFDGGDAMTVLRLPFADALAVIYSPPLSNEVRLRNARAITGPWSRATTLFVTDRRGADGTTYDANAHPELAEDDGRIQFVTFSRPNGNGWFGADLALMRVELALR